MTDKISELDMSLRLTFRPETVLILIDIQDIYYRLLMDEDLISIKSAIDKVFSFVIHVAINNHITINNIPEAINATVDDLYDFFEKLYNEKKIDESTLYILQSSVHIFINATETLIVIIENKLTWFYLPIYLRNKTLTIREYVNIQSSDIKNLIKLNKE